MVSLAKNALYKTVGKAKLLWRELEEVLLEIENALNNRLLTYVEDGVEYPILTSNTLAIGQKLMLPNKNLETENRDLCKRFKYIQKWKEAAWLRWRKKYIKLLRERHNMKSKDRMSIAKVGEVVIIQSDNRNKGKWRLGIITDVFPAPDNTVRAVRDGVCQTNKNFKTNNNKLNPEATEFRPKRNAEAIAELKITSITQVENEPPQAEWLKDMDNTTNNKRFHEHIFNSYN